MSHERIDGEQVFNCDGKGCNANVGYDLDVTFQDAWEDAKSDGWTSATQGNTWLHLCKKCTQKMGG